MTEITLLSVVRDISNTYYQPSLSGILPEMLIAAAATGVMALTKKQKRKLRWLSRLAKWQQFFSRGRGNNGLSSGTKGLMTVLLILIVVLGLGILVSWVAALIALTIALCILALKSKKTSR